jgi:hypothetical protein
VALKLLTREVIPPHHPQLEGTMSEVAKTIAAARLVGEIISSAVTGSPGLQAQYAKQQQVQQAQRVQQAQQNINHSNAQKAAPAQHGSRKP